MDAKDSETELRRVTVVCTFYQDRDRAADACARLAPMAARGAQVLLVDDASPDGTAEVLRSVAPVGPSVEVIARETNGGVAASRNDALSRATGEFLWFCDSDDDWPPDVLDLLLAGVSSPEVDVVVAGARIVEYRTHEERSVDAIDRATIMIGVEGSHAMLTGRLHGYLWNKLFRRTSVVGLRFPALRSQSDFAFTYRAVAGARCISWTTGVVYQHLLRSGSVSQTSRGVDRNLRHCYDLVIDDLRQDGREDRAAEDYFRLWFYVVPATRAIVRSDTPENEAIAAVRVVARSVTLAPVIRVARRSPRIAAQCLVIRLAPRLVTRVYRSRHASRQDAAPAKGR